jgi:hypothetical protein
MAYNTRFKPSKTNYFLHKGNKSATKPRPKLHKNTARYTHTICIGNTENTFAKVTVSKCVNWTEIETKLNTYIGVHINKIYNVRL